MNILFLPARGSRQPSIPYKYWYKIATFYLLEATSNDQLT